MSNLRKLLYLIGCFLLYSTNAVAEGLIDITPYVSTSVNYDDNLFRLASDEKSDVVKRLEFGLDMNVRLSQQVIALSANINENKYNEFDLLDNTGSNYRLVWNWRLGSHLFGELSSRQTKAITSFNEIRNTVNNLTTSTRQRASVNWRFHPSWVVTASRESGEYANDLATAATLDRDDEVYETAIRYQSQTGSEVGLSYRVVDNTYPGRVGNFKLIFGDENQQKDIALSVVWQPTVKTRLNAQLTKIDLSYQDLPNREFNGLSKTLDFDYLVTDKTRVNVSVFRQLSPVDDLVSTFIERAGLRVTPTLAITSKSSLQGSLGYVSIDYLGSSGFLNNLSDRREETSNTRSLAFNYQASNKLFARLQYESEKRDSNILNLDYTYNSFNLLFKYTF